jgi:hypothetical protein
MHPANLALRFALELVAVGAIGFWGFERGTGVLRYVLAVALPLVVMIAWAVFAVPGDPSRGKDGVVRVPGVVRLALELAVFGLGAFALHDVGWTIAALVVGACTAAHYALSFRRLGWLVRS